VTKGYKSATTI